METLLITKNESWREDKRPTSSVSQSLCPRSVRLTASLALATLFFSVTHLHGQLEDYREAQERYQRQEYLLAMLAAQKAVEQDGENADYRHLYGMTLLQLKQFTDAEPHLRKALTLKPTSAEFHYGLAALILQERNETKDRTDPMGMGSRISTSTAVEESIQLLEKALELNPHHLKARMHLGRTYHEQNMRSKALHQFETVASKDPRYAWIHYHLSAIHLDAGRFQEALQALQREVAYHPDHGQARLELGDLLLQIGKPKLALAQLTAVAKDSETVSLPDLYFGLAKVYRKLGQLDKAITAVRQCIELAPDIPAAHRLLAKLYEDTGQSQSARQALETYEKLKGQMANFSR